MLSLDVRARTEQELIPPKGHMESTTRRDLPQSLTSRAMAFRHGRNEVEIQKSNFDDRIAIGQATGDRGRGPLATNGHSIQDSTGADSRLGISSAGDPTITITYTPEASDKSTKIVFIQVVQTSIDGVAVKPGTANPAWSHLDADATADFFVVDHLAGETDPYYNGDDIGLDSGTQGNATSTPPVKADMTDKPNMSDAGFPAGKTKFKAEFRTIAFSAAGTDKGKFYAYTRWAYNKEKGNPSSISQLGTSTSTALPLTRAAIDTWCTNHGFVLPK